MAKLEIIESKQGVRESKTPNTISLSLPFTLAQTQKAGINAVAKSIKDIQKDLYALEDDNQYNEAIKDVNILINKEYDKYFRIPADPRDLNYDNYFQLGSPNSFNAI